ncbi:hypothetical protein BC937DRAFT_92282 [Endogone sp. FLAS-F59071]|nr:hypothetical protein BC937DRAFT_92282 [Endogone sp. FLAS-F59071]|eukprot:RUS15570.1 hypothetical protein BC937DRAFT_92282 [Endogone sp. FLAS-F59071]
MEEALEKGIDTGCGPRIWTLDMAKDYPLSQFVGIDATKVFPMSCSLPNCSFIQANTLKGLPFPDNTFDYVFQRLFILAFAKKDLAVAIAELIRVTKPGGWIEMLRIKFNFLFLLILCTIAAYKFLSKPCI